MICNKYCTNPYKRIVNFDFMVRLYTLFYIKCDFMVRLYTLFYIKCRL